MNTRERIITIRLLEKAARHPAAARAVGIEASRTGGSGAS